MKIDRRNFILSACAGGLVASAPQIVRANVNPTRIICPYAPGGGTDTVTRIMAEGLSQLTGQSYIVENKPGVGGLVGHQYVASAKPDGKTLLLGAIGPLVIAPYLSKITYDPQKDLAPLTMAVIFPNVLVVSPSVGVKNLKEFIALAKKQPLSYASTGAGSAAHLAGELLNDSAGLDMLHVPYKGGSQAMLDLLAGRVSAYYATPSSSQPYIKSGKLIALATTGEERSELLPDVPTLKESGYPGAIALNWYTFMAPAETPKGIQETLNKDMVAVLKDPKTRSELSRHGMTPAPSTQDELRQFISAESKRWGQLIKDRNIAAN